jgi:hypothetical protein
MLAPGIYDVELVEDVDENGRWSTGNYDSKKQPERVFKKTLEELRANWDVDAEISATSKPINKLLFDPLESSAPPVGIPEGDFNKRINNSGRGN